jgi:hypothetical protein
MMCVIYYQILKEKQWADEVKIEKKTLVILEFRAFTRPFSLLLCSLNIFTREEKKKWRSHPSVWDGWCDLVPDPKSSSAAAIVA